MLYVTCEYIQNCNTSSGAVVYCRIRKLQNQGVLRYLEHKWISKPEMRNINGPLFHQVTLEHIYGILIFYVIVIFICMLLFVAEVLVNRSAFEFT